MFLSEQLENRMFLSVTVAAPVIELATAEPTTFQPKQEGSAQYYTDSQEGVIPGDANLDGVVNLADFDILASNFGMGPGMGFGDGDFNGDGFVTLIDLNILASNFGVGAAAEGGTTDSGTGDVIPTNSGSAFGDTLISGVSGDAITADPRAVPA